MKTLMSDDKQLRHIVQLVRQSAKAGIQGAKYEEFSYG
jgi:hypothetical protein